jgi:hypothetical protein
LDCPGSCHCRHRGHWERRGAECTTTTADAARATATAASHASHAATHANAKADAPRPDAHAYAHATASKRWVCASSHANAYATGASFCNDGASITRTNAHAKTAQRFYVACSNASDRQTFERRNAKSSFCAESTTSQRWRHTFTYARSAPRLSIISKSNPASLPDCAGHANTAEAACHVR